MKKVFCILFILHCTLNIENCFAQQPTQEWVRKYSSGTNIYASGLSVKLDMFGNVYVLVNVGTDSTYRDYGILKYSPSGDLLWVAYYNSPENLADSPIAFAVTSAGDIYITGTSGINFVYHTLTVKYSSNGVFQWEKVYNGGMGDGPNDITLDRQGNIIITGAVAISNNNTYGFTIKYNSNGDTLWVRLFTQYQTSINYKLVTDDSCNIYTTGYHKVNSLQTNFLTLKYNSNGILKWFNSYGIPPQGGSGQSIAIDSNKNVYVVGDMYTLEPGYSNNALVKIKPNGDTAWARIYKGIGGNNLVSFTPRGVSVTPGGSSIYYTTACASVSNSYFVTLAYNSVGDTLWSRFYPINISGTPQFNPMTLKLDRYLNIYITGWSYFTLTGNDYITIKYLPSGIQQWAVTYNGYNNYGDGAADVIIDTSLNVYVTGISRKITNNSSDAVTLKYNQVIGIKQISSNLPNDFRLFQNYPNPFNPVTRIAFQIPRSSSVKINVYDILGRELTTLVNEKLSPGTYETDWEASNYTSGVYFYQLLADGIVIDTKKLILIK